jgi:hypothetical protein
MSRLPNLPERAPDCSSELGTGTTQGEHDMARQSRMKLAALATTLVAALGIVAIAPATAADAGGSRSVGPKQLCC